MPEIKHEMNMHVSQTEDAKRYERSDSKCTIYFKRPKSKLKFLFQWLKCCCSSPSETSENFQTT